MSCRIRIEQISANPPYFGDQPYSISVTGRVARDCPLVRVGVFPHAQASEPLFPEQTVETTTQSIAPGVDPDSTEGDARWTAEFGFNPADPDYGLIRCARRLRVVAEWPGHEDTCRVDDDNVKIQCKGAAETGSPGYGGSGGSGGWDWPELDLGQCFLAKWAYISLVFAGLMSLFLGVCLSSGALLAVAAVFFGASAGALLLWKNGCGVTSCEHRGLLCWIFKWATTATFVLFVVFLCPVGSAVMAGYGVVCGWLVLGLRWDGCPVPPMTTTPP